MPVIYSYQPKWSNPEQPVLGILCTSRRVGHDHSDARIQKLTSFRQSTIAVVRHAFDELTAADDDITFHARFENGAPLARIPDSLWQYLTNKPPQSIWVKVKTAPGPTEPSESTDTEYLTSPR